MKKIDKDGLLLCEIQANLFEESLIKTNCSSEVFIRRYMNSEIATVLDSTAFLDDTKTTSNIFDEIKEEYGISNYGTNKFNSETLYWIGYLYRYFSYTYELSSKEVYKIIKPKELNELYLPYHTLDLKAAIDRILEEKNISFDEKDMFDRSYKIFKRIRQSKVEND